VLWPNHAADFDSGVVRVGVDGRRLDLPVDDAVDGTVLAVAEDHPLEEAALRYHEAERCRLR